MASPISAMRPPPHHQHQQYHQRSMQQQYSSYQQQFHEDRHPSFQHEEYEEEEGLAPDMEDTSHMKFVDGRCSCCPYGYHIDVDFLKYGENKNSGQYLQNLKKIKHNKRKLRKSMEFFLQQQEKAAQGEMSAPPPDVVHSSEHFMTLVENEESAANKVLEQIDVSVNQSIDLLRSANRKQQRIANMSKSSDSADDYEDELDMSPGSSYYQQHNSSYHQQQQHSSSYQQQLQREQRERYRTEAELMLHENPAGQPLGKSESVSSLSSQSTFSSEQPASSMYSGSSTNQQTSKYSSHMYITSTQLAGQMASIFQDGNLVPGEHPGDMKAISSSQLKAIREQMGISLQRMRELEEQVKAIPVLQVRISVLKEEKRLLNLQLKAKNNKMNMRSVGVGDLDINDYVEAGRPRSRSPTPRSFEIGDFHSYKRYNGEVPARPRPELRTIGVGDGNVFAYDNYQVQMQMVSGTGESSTKERELHTEQSTHVMEKEKEIHTLLLGTDAGRMDSLLQNRKRAERPKAPTRTIGVGDGNVFDPSSNVHVHEKETKTVIIGGKETKNKSVRNVGLLCKAQMRDVGVMYHYDFDRPQTRSVAIGINEGLFSGELVESDGTPAGPTSSTVIHNMLQQLNMAAFHTRNINIRAEDLRLVIDEKLRKEVHSVGVQTRFSTQDVGINHCGYEKHSVAVGDDTLDVDIRPVVQTRSIGVDHRPSTQSRLVSTEPTHTKDASTYMRQEFGSSKSTNTDKVLTYPAATNTEIVRTYEVQTDTDIKIFQALEVIKNTGVNTPRVSMHNSAVNTDQEEPTLMDEKGTTTHGLIHVHHKAANTDMQRQVTVGVGDQSVDEEPECEVCLNKPMLRNAQVGTIPVPTRDRGVGYGKIEVKDLTTEQEEVEETVTKTVSKEIKTSQAQSPLSGSTVITKEYSSRGGYGGSGSGGTTITREITRSSSGTGGTNITREYSSPSSTTGSTVVTREYTSRGRYGGGLSSADREDLTDGVTRHTEVVTRNGVTTTREYIMKNGVRIDVTGEAEQQEQQDASSRSGGTTITREITSSSSGTGGTNITREYSSPSSSTGSTVVTREYSSRGRYGGGLSSADHEDLTGGVTRHTEVVTRNGVTTTREYIMKNGVRIDVTGEAEQQEQQDASSRSGGTTITREITSSSSGTGGTNITREYSSPSSSSGSSVITREYSSRGRYGGGLSSADREDLTGGVTRHTEVVTRNGVTTTREYIMKNGVRIDVTGESELQEQQDASEQQGFQFETSPSGGHQMKVIRTTETAFVGDRPVNKRSDVVFQDEEGRESSQQSSSSNQRMEQVEMTASSSSSSSHKEANMAEFLGTGAISGSSSSTGGRFLGRRGRYSPEKRLSASATTTEAMLGGEQHSSVAATTEAMLGTERRTAASATTTETMLGGGGMQTTITKTSSTSPGGRLHGRTTTVRETRVERRATGATGDNGSSSELKSIMKQPGTPTSERKEIKFADGTVGGNASSSSDDEDTQDAGQDARSDDSFDEGSYDGRLGRIVYTCKDDERIAQGAPGAMMYDQNIRETYELSADMRKSCDLYSRWLENSTVATTRELNSALNVIQENWFKISSHKLSSAAQVEDYLSSFNQISPHLLEHVVNMADANGNTALHYAVSHCSMEIVSLLLDTGLVDVNKQNKAGYTATMLASLANIQSEKDKGVIKQLFLRGDINSKASQAGQTALMLAVSHGRVDMVKMLLSAGADVNTQDDDGSTALMCACEHGHTDIVKFLLSHPDCDPSITDNDGSTAMSIAMEAGHRDVGVLLYAHTNFRPGSSPITKVSSLTKVHKGYYNTYYSPLSRSIVGSTRTSYTRPVLKKSWSLGNV